MFQPPPPHHPHDLYQTLGVSKEASQVDIKKAYRKLALSKHPDKGGDAREFHTIQQAYEILSDPKKREQYDNPQMGHPLQGLFDLIKKQQQSSPDYIYEYQVSLSQLYNGATVKVDISQVKDECENCHSTGRKDDIAVSVCHECNGAGMSRLMNALGMGGMFQQVVSVCQKCKGSGEIVKPEDVCPVCKGDKLTDTTRTVEFTIEKGADYNTPISVENQGHKIPGRTRGTVIIVLRPPENNEKNLLKKEGDNLVYQCEIELIDALYGAYFSIEHLDGRVLNYHINHIITPETQKVIKNEGMPCADDNTCRGDLIIKFKIKFPEELYKGSKQVCSKILQQKSCKQSEEKNYIMI